MIRTSFCAISMLSGAPRSKLFQRAGDISNFFAKAVWLLPLVISRSRLSL